MRHDFLDRYSRTPGPLQRLPAGLKLASALILILITVTMPAGTIAPGAAIMLFVLAAMSRIPAMFLIRRLLFFQPVLAGMAALNLLRPDGGSLFVTLLVKSNLCLCTAILLSNTTPFADILSVLRRIGMPKILLTVLALMYRYLFVLIDEAERMHRARLSRSVEVARFSRWTSLASLVGTLFVRSTERAERIYAAMCARGWQ